MASVLYCPCKSPLLTSTDGTITLRQLLVVGQAAFDFTKLYLPLLEDGRQEPLPYLDPQEPPVGTPCQAKRAPDLIPCQTTKTPIRPYMARYTTGSQGSPDEPPRPTGHKGLLSGRKCLLLGHEGPLLFHKCPLLGRKGPDQDTRVPCQSD